MADHLMIQARLPYLDGVPRDLAINTFHVFAPETILDGTPILSAIVTELTEFYNEPTAGTASIADHLSPAIDRGEDACQFRIFRAEAALGVDGKVHYGDPVAEAQWQLADSEFTGQWPLPLEVAACVSWVGRLTAYNDVSQPARRRRGRDYIGPLSSGAVDTSPAIYPAMNVLFRTTLSEAGDRLVSRNWDGGALDGDRLFYWSVFSRTLQEGTQKPPGSPQPMNGSMFPIVGGWVDDEMDTQRRRQINSTSRDVFVSND